MKAEDYRGPKLVRFRSVLETRNQRVKSTFVIMLVILRYVASLTQLNQQDEFKSM